jgi:hypothetical protein
MDFVCGNLMIALFLEFYLKIDIHSLTLNQNHFQMFVWKTIAANYGGSIRKYDINPMNWNIFHSFSNKEARQNFPPLSALGTQAHSSTPKRIGK